MPAADAEFKQVMAAAADVLAQERAPAVGFLGVLFPFTDQRPKPSKVGVEAVGGDGGRVHGIRLSGTPAAQSLRVLSKPFPSSPKSEVFRFLHSRDVTFISLAFNYCSIILLVKRQMVDPLPSSS